MQSVSNDWKAKALQDSTLYDISITVAGVTYKAFPEAPVIHRYGVTEDLIGGALVSALEFSIIPEGDIPKAAACVVWAGNSASGYTIIQGDDDSIIQGDDDATLISKRGSGSSESLCLGTFYINTRKPDKKTGIVKYTCYDAMRKADVPFTDNTRTYPMDADDAVAVIAAAMGWQTINCGSLTGTIDTPVGVYTYRETLAYIGAMNGGNFIIDETGKLKFVQLATPSTSVTSCMAGSIEMSGDSVKVSKVMLFVDSGIYVEDGTATNDCVSADCPFANLNGANRATMALGYITGAEYYPYKADTAPLDPAVQVGDTVTVSHKTFRLYNYDIVLGRKIYYKIEHPGKDELEQEFIFADPETRSIDRTVAKSYSEITKTTDEIAMRVVALQDTLDHSVDLGASAYEFVKVSGSWSPASITIYDNKASSKSGGTYKWYEDGTQVTGSSSTYTLANTEPNTKQKVVKCEWSDGHGNTFTDQISFVWLEDGAQGTSISAVEYAISSSGTTVPTSGWSTDPLTPDQGQWLWTRTTYSNGLVVYNKSYVGVNASIMWNLLHNTMTPSLDNLPSINGYENGVIGFQGQTPSVAEHGVRIEVTSALRPYIRIGAGAANAGLHGLVPGKTYTLSFDAKWKVLSGTATNTTYYMQASLYDNSADPDTIEADSRVNFAAVTRADKGTEMSARCEATFTIPANATKLYFLIANSRATNSNYASGDYIECSNMMLVEGSTPAGWAPCYEETVGPQGAPGEDGEDGADGTTITSVQYGVSDSETTEPSSWSSTMPTLQQGDWLWTKTTYSNGSTAYTKSYAGTDGTDGTNGTDGRDGEDGIDGYTVVLTNEYVEIPVDAERQPLEQHSYQTQTRVYKGTTLLTPTTGTPAEGQYQVSGQETPPEGLTVSHSTPGTFTFTTQERSAVATYNLLHNTVNPSVASTQERININGHDGTATQDAGYVVFPSSGTTKGTATHGVKVTTTKSVRPYLQFGVTGGNTDGNSGLYGLEAGQTYTMSFNAYWRLISYGSNGTLTFDLFSDVSGSAWANAPYSTQNIATIHHGQEEHASAEITFTIPAGSTQMFIRIRPSDTTASNYAAGDYIQLEYLMLVAGAEAAPWAPAANESTPQGQVPIADEAEYEIYVTPYGAPTFGKKIIFRANMNQQVAENRAEINIQSDKIALVVEETEAGNVIKAASIVTAINEDGSSIKLEADKIDLDGYVTISNLRDGRTVISGSNIQTGAIDASEVTVYNLDADNITAGTIDADYVNVNGALQILTGGRWASLAGYIGAAASANIGESAGACVASSNGSGYYIATNSGSRITYGSYSIYCSSGGAWTNDPRGVNSSSDRRLKTDIDYDMSRLNSFFDHLKPCTFRRIDIAQNKTNIGLIAQDVLAAEEQSGVDDLAIISQTEIPGREGMYYGLAYSEMIALCIDQIQKLKARVNELEANRDDGR